MKNIIALFVITLGLLSQSPVFPGTGGNEATAETFLLEEGSPICLSIENYQKKDGWTPVVLSLGELNCLLWMDEAHRVSELREPGDHLVEPVCYIDETTQGLRKGANTLYFDIYDQNQVRTRWILSPGGTAGIVPKKILFREGGIDLCLGNLRLQLNYVAWDFQELSPGLFQVQFHGPMVLKHRELVVEKAKGIIYSTHGRNNRLPTGQSHTWSMNPNRSASGSIPPQERAALIALYKSTIGDNWYVNLGWKKPPLADDGFALPGTENTWWGITCDSGNTTVQSISLDGNNLNRRLPPELGNLANLQKLDLRFNHLCSSIPPELGNLANLQELHLEINQLSGSIPPELGNLANLQYLVLANNQLSGSIPPELGNLANLQGLYLELNQLSGSIPPELGNLANLQILRLSGNQLSGSITPELGNLANLQELFLELNQLIGSIPPELGNLANLHYLILVDNQLSGSIPPELGNLANLLYLDLRKNQLSGSIPPELGNLANLHFIFFGSNQISGSIPPELGKLANLIELELYANQLSGTIPPELGKLDDLLGLYLEENQLSGSIPPELGNLANLKYLYLYGNRLSGSIPSNLTNLTNLVKNHLNLRWNALYTNDDILRDFLNSKQLGGNWEDTQTIAPPDVTAASVSPTSIDIHWTPIAYTPDNGGYRVFYSTTPGGPYTYFGITADKNASSLPVTGLNPGTTYYFAVQTRTNPHADNQNTVDSEYSVEVSAATPQAITISGKVTPGGSGLPDVIITLSNNGGTTTTDPNGNYSITVPYGWSGTATPSKPGYSFTPSNRSYSNVTENQTDQDFLGSIMTDLTLTSPDGGENWKLSSIRNITWNVSGITGLLKITLWKGGSQIGVIANNVNPAAGSYSWTVGQYLGGMAVPGTDYKIKIKEIGSSTADSSNANFTLSPGITVTAPNGGQTWKIGDAEQITWISGGLTNLIKITLWKDNVLVGTIANVAPAGGSYSWTVGNYIGGTAAPGAGYKIKIKENGTSAADTSDSAFTLIN